MKKVFNLMLLCATMMCAFSSCSDDENAGSRLNQDELTLTAGQSAKLIYDGEDCSWESEEPLIAEVDNEGNVLANRVGVTNIYANDDVCRVTVLPQYNTYMGPCMDWGASKSSVESFMEGFDLLTETEEVLYYIDATEEFEYFYNFENNALSSSMVLTNILSNGDEVVDFLLERYVVIDVNEAEYSATMISVDAKLIVGLLLNAQPGLMAIIYMPYDATKNISSKSLRIGIPKLEGTRNLQNNVDAEVVEKLMDKLNY